VTFRLRVLALVSVVAVGAVGATAFLAYRQTVKQATESAAADRDTVTQIVNTLDAFARRHGTWEGVSRTVRELSGGSGQRIKLVTESEQVIVDSDTLADRTARVVSGPPVLVDPRPTLTFSAGSDAALREATLDAIQRYRTGIRFAACLTRHGIGVTTLDGPNGIPTYLPGSDSVGQGTEWVRICQVDSRTTYEAADDARRVGACSPSLQDISATNRGELVACLRRAFAERTVEVAPVIMRVYIGAIGEARPALTPGPVILAATLVALLAVVGTVLLSHRVLQPIDTLTAAANRFGDGDLTQRVPAAGHDEIAQLARSFNRMADSLQAADDRQRRLVADVAHELRTPLSNLRGYLEALKDGVVPASQELFVSLHEEAVLQQRLVADLQDLALAEAGALTYYRVPTDLAELLEVCRYAHQAAADEAGVALRLADVGPIMVDADPDRLRQVLANLLSNALRATPAGGSVTLGTVDVGDGWAAVVVRDTGTGISATDLPYIFDRFWRTDSARGRSTGGSGLGLAIARQIVTDHGGRIAAQSEPGRGTAVTVTLPVIRQPR
jgi:two-component system sensor histidine kinase BaeS